MKKWILLSTAFLSSLIFLSSCGPTLTVTNDYDHSVNFSKYKTFRIVKLEQHVQNISQLNQTRIINAVRNEMISKGFSETENADMFIDITTTLKDKQELVANSTGGYGGYGGYYRWGGGYSTTTVSTYNYKDGSLVVDIVDASNNNLLWQGIGSKQIDAPSKNPDQDVPAAVKQIMASFPPGQATKK